MFNSLTFEVCAHQACRKEMGSFQKAIQQMLRDPQSHLPAVVCQTREIADSMFRLLHTAPTTAKAFIALKLESRIEFLMKFVPRTHDTQKHGVESLQEAVRTIDKVSAMLRTFINMIVTLSTLACNLRLDNGNLIRQQDLQNIVITKQREEIDVHNRKQSHIAIGSSSSAALDSNEDENEDQKSSHAVNIGRKRVQACASSSSRNCKRRRIIQSQDEEADDEMTDSQDRSESSQESGPDVCNEPAPLDATHPNQDDSQSEREPESPPLEFASASQLPSQDPIEDPPTPLAEKQQTLRQFVLSKDRLEKQRPMFEEWKKDDLKGFIWKMDALAKIKSANKSVLIDKIMFMHPTTVFATMKEMRIPPRP